MAEQHPILAKARITPEIFQLRPDYRALLIVVENIPTGPSDDKSEALLQDAESSSRAILARGPTTEIPHIAAWREAYKAFGAKPNKTRNSVEALTRRLEKADGKLPRINRVTDIYNAISVKHHIPVGGEDLDKYSGAPFLVRAVGDEKFETTADGKPVIEHPDKGEVIWCDEAGVTCRRWNWRQGPRTALGDDSSRVLFILDALDPLSAEALTAAGDELIAALKRLGPDVRESKKLLHAGQ